MEVVYYCKKGGGIGRCWAQKAPHDGIGTKLIKKRDRRANKKKGWGALQKESEVNRRGEQTASNPVCVIKINSDTGTRSEDTIKES